MADERLEVDVIVIGGGGAGLSAAAEAASAGAKVLLLEKNPALGGSTAWSVGSISATNTPHQRARGIVDSPQAHFEDLEVLAGRHAARDNRALRRILVDNTTALIDWLMGLGVQFVGPNDEPPHRVPRMHNVIPNSRAFPYHLGRHCRRIGVDIRLDAHAERLTREGGRIVGVEARLPGGRLAARARCGVVLASGDFSASAALKARFANELVAALEPVNPTATGDGFALALEQGAEIVNGDIVRGPIMRFVPPMRQSLMRRLPPHALLARAMRWSAENLPAAIQRPMLMSFLVTALGPSPELFRAGAILVNRRGARFADELAGAAPTLPAQPDKVAYILFDRTIAEKFTAWPNYISTAPGIAYAYLDDYRRNRRDIFHRGATLDALAAGMGVPAAALRDTIAAHNAALPAGGARTPLVTPPFTALGPVKSYVVFTDGGLRVSERLEVLDQSGAPIPGLYAAGSAGQGGLLLEGHGHHLGWAFISGRIAGRHAAQARFAAPSAAPARRPEAAAS
jgi:succinate dehydrogenase/fumarate reductase flavoprotein subunit